MSSKFSPYASVILRIGLAAVFMWFGMSELLNPAQWIGFMPGWLTSLTGLSAVTLVVLNALFEVVAAVCLVMNWYVRLVALLLSLHLFTIVGDVGFSAIGVRDFGLAAAMLSLALFEEREPNPLQ